MIRFIEQRLDLVHLPFSINGIGINEPSAPNLVDRPGTGDWMLMLFHKPCFLRIKETLVPYPAGTLCLWDPKDYQYYGNADRHWLHSWIHVQGHLAEELLQNSGIFPCKPLQLKDNSFFTEILNLLFKEVRLQPHPDNLIQQNLFHNLLRHIARDCFHSLPAIPSRLLKVKTYIDTHTTTAQHLASLARMAGMSIPHFSALFKKNFGFPPIEYSIRQRLNHARFLLCNSALPITEVAEQTGYENIFSFSRQFRQYLGTSPRHYRQEQR